MKYLSLSPAPANWQIIIILTLDVHPWFHLHSMEAQDEGHGPEERSSGAHLVEESGHNFTEKEVGGLIGDNAGRKAK